MASKLAKTQTKRIGLDEAEMLIDDTLFWWHKGALETRQAAFELRHVGVSLDMCLWKLLRTHQRPVRDAHTKRDFALIWN